MLSEIVHWLVDNNPVQVSLVSFSSHGSTALIFLDSIPNATRLPVVCSGVTDLCLRIQSASIRLSIVAAKDQFVELADSESRSLLRCKSAAIYLVKPEVLV